MLDIFSGTVATVGKTQRDEPIQGFPVMVDALALIVGSVFVVRPVRPLVPFKTKPLQVFQTVFDKLGFAAGFVDILDP